MLSLFKMLLKCFNGPIKYGHAGKATDTQHIDYHEIAKTSGTLVMIADGSIFIQFTICKSMVEDEIHINISAVRADRNSYIALLTM